MTSKDTQSRVLSAAAVSAVPQVSLKVLGMFHTTFLDAFLIHVPFEGSDSVHGIQNFRVTALLKNTGDEPLRSQQQKMEERTENTIFKSWIVKES